MNQEAGIKLIRLNTGEDIIANCLDDEANNTVTVGNPMRVVIRRIGEASQSMLVMMPWLPLEIVQDDFAILNYQDIITIIDPKKSFVEYYNNMVDQYKVNLELMDEENLFENQLEDNDVDEETVQEMIDILKEKRNKSLH